MESRSVVAWRRDWERWGLRNTKGHKEAFGDDRYAYYLDCDNGFMGINMSKLCKLYTLGMSGISYANYISIKLF